MFNIFKNNKKKKTDFKISEELFTLEDFERNAIIFGGTGSGKTKAILLPILDNLIKNNIPGIIVDVKNNFTDDVYKIASKYGRIDNIIEIGNFDSAEKINFLNDIDLDMFIHIIKLISEEDSTNDSYWMDTGLLIFKDVIKVYFLMYKYNLVPKPSMYIIVKLISNKLIAEDLYKQFEHNKDMYLEEFIELNEIIFSKPYHQFHNKIKDDEDGNSERQLGWSIGKISQILSVFLEVNNVETFSNVLNDNFSLNFDKLFYQENKIIIMRFSETSDENLSKVVVRSILEKQKSDVMLSKRKQYSFRLIDEYQNVINTKEDGSWLDKSREFKNIQIFATQSLQSLLSKEHNKDSVYTLVDNCKNKFFLNSNNPITEEFYKSISIIKKFKPLKFLKGSGEQRETIYNNGNEEIKFKVDFKYYSELQKIDDYIIPEKEYKNNIYKDVKFFYNSILDLNIYYKPSKIDNIIKLFEINKPNGIISENYIIEYIEKYIQIEYELELYLKFISTIEKKINFNEEIIFNIIKPITNTTTYNDFYTGFENDLNLIENYKINTITHKEFIKDYDNLFTENSINIFIIGGNYSFVASQTTLMESIKRYILKNKNKNSLNIFGLGHSDFIHPINLMADYSYNTPDGTGTRLIKNLIENKNKENLIEIKKEFYSYSNNKFDYDTNIKTNSYISNKIYRLLEVKNYLNNKEVEIEVLNKFLELNIDIVNKEIATNDNTPIKILEILNNNENEEIKLKSKNQKNIQEGKSQAKNILIECKNEDFYLNFNKIKIVLEKEKINYYLTKLDNEYFLSNEEDFYNFKDTHKNFLNSFKRLNKIILDKDFSYKEIYIFNNNEEWFENNLLDTLTFEEEKELLFNNQMIRMENNKLFIYILNEFDLEDSYKEIINYLNENNKLNNKISIIKKELNENISNIDKTIKKYNTNKENNIIQDKFEEIIDEFEDEFEENYILENSKVEEVLIENKEEEKESKISKFLFKNIFENQKNLNNYLFNLTYSEIEELSYITNIKKFNYSIKEEDIVFNKIKMLYNSFNYFNFEFEEIDNELKKTLNNSYLIFIFKIINRNKGTLLEKDLNITEYNLEYTTKYNLKIEENLNLLKLHIEKLIFSDKFKYYFNNKDILIKEILDLNIPDINKLLINENYISIKNLDFIWNRLNNELKKLVIEKNGSNYYYFKELLNANKLTKENIEYLWLFSSFELKNLIVKLNKTNLTSKMELFNIMKSKTIGVIKEKIKETSNKIELEEYLSSTKLEIRLSSLKRVLELGYFLNKDFDKKFYFEFDKSKIVQKFYKENIDTLNKPPL